MDTKILIEQYIYTPNQYPDGSADDAFATIWEHPMRYCLPGNIILMTEESEIDAETGDITVSEYIVFDTEEEAALWILKN